MFIASAVFIAFMWAKSDVVSIYTTAPKEQLVVLIVTTVAVSLFKVGLIAGAVLLAKWFVGKTRNKVK